MLGINIAGTQRSGSDKWVAHRACPISCLEPLTIDVRNFEGLSTLARAGP